MRVAQSRWTAEAGWGPAPEASDPPPDLILVFGDRDALDAGDALPDIQAAFPRSPLAGCTTSGEILDAQVSDGAVTSTAITFDHTRVQVAVEPVGDDADPDRIGAALADALAGEGLVHVLVFSDGTRVNGSGLVAGMEAHLPGGVQVTGGLAGDRDRFEKTLVVAPDGVHEGAVVAVGLYGDRLRVGYGSLGGWDPFGPLRRVTRSKANVLYELDGQPALKLYKDYLGEQAKELPASGLLFPLSVQLPGREGEVVRTILAVDEEDQSLIFAGDVPEGAMARLMKANFDRLVDGAHGAAEKSHEGLGEAQPDLALLISCVGRKLVLKQRVEEELEAVQEVIGDAPMTGFYSYGEICPAAPDAACELHNQTMTITTLRED